MELTAYLDVVDSELNSKIDTDYCLFHTNYHLLKKDMDNPVRLKIQFHLFEKYSKHILLFLTFTVGNIEICK